MYRRHLVAVSDRVQTIVKRFAPTGHVQDLYALTTTLNHYADLLIPWARTVTARMHADVSKRDAVSWMELAREMGGLLRKEIFTTPVGVTMREAMLEQVDLITSLPRNAALRVHRLTTEGLITAGRASEIATEILRTGLVTKARANTIARTETSRTASLLLEARAGAIGSTHYRWHSAQDSDVRPEHRRLNGNIFRWDDPPLAAKSGEHANPGCIWNCFPGNVRVSLGNGIKHLWRVPYKGEVIDLVFGGELVTLTPNHPILTTHGWLPARLVNQGDYVICFPDQVKNVTEQNIDNVLPTFDKLFGSFIESATLRSGATFGFQFYGDVFDGDVDEIAFDRSLPDYGIATLFQKIGQLSLSDTNRRIFTALSSGLSHVGEAFLPSGGDQSLLLACRQLTHAYAIGSASVPAFNPRLDQMPCDDRSRDSIFERESEFAHSMRVLMKKLLDGKRYPVISAAPNDLNSASPEFLAEHVGIAANDSRGIFEHGARVYESCRVSDKIVRNLSGHVFTMETLSGWYDTTSTGKHGLVARNCRCWAEPILPDEAVAIRPMRRVA